MGEMAALRAAKKGLRALMRQRLSQVSQESLQQQCLWNLQISVRSGLLSSHSDS